LDAANALREEALHVLNETVPSLRKEIESLRARTEELERSDRALRDRVESLENAHARPVASVVRERSIPAERERIMPVVRVVAPVDLRAAEEDAQPAPAVRRKRRKKKKKRKSSAPRVRAAHLPAGRAPPPSCGPATYDVETWLAWHFSGADTEEAGCWDSDPRKLRDYLFAGRYEIAQSVKDELKRRIRMTYTPRMRPGEQILEPARPSRAYEDGPYPEAEKYMKTHYTDPARWPPTESDPEEIEQLDEWLWWLHDPRQLRDHIRDLHRLFPDCVNAALKERIRATYTSRMPFGVLPLDPAPASKPDAVSDDEKLFADEEMNVTPTVSRSASSEQDEARLVDGKVAVCVAPPRGSDEELVFQDDGQRGLKLFREGILTSDHLATMRKCLEEDRLFKKSMDVT
jgi:hypothetical protein